MKTCGIICEYNPFHSGHAAHISSTREMLGEDTAIMCCMSGNFVQRGEPAALEKHVRAEMAVRGGADLVIELPVAWATATAERFAVGAVSLINATGVVDAISFGSECGDIEKLRTVAAVLASDEAFELIKTELDNGISYAAARQLAAERLLGGDAEILHEPNNILAVEYIKAIDRLGAELEPVTVGRIATKHDGAPVGQFASGSALRDMLRIGEDISEFVPAKCMETIKTELNCGNAPVFSESLEQMMMYRLRTMSDEEYSGLPDGREGLWMRLMKYGRTAATYKEVLEKTKTKRYALSRIRRMTLAALLGIDSTMSSLLPPYIRVLAFNERGQEMLHTMRKTASLPVITKPASAKALPDTAKKVFEFEARADDIYSLGVPGEKLRGGSEWLRGPVIVK